MLLLTAEDFEDDDYYEEYLEVMERKNGERIAAYFTKIDKEGECYGGGYYGEEDIMGRRISGMADIKNDFYSPIGVSCILVDSFLFLFS
jgi:hypothetical protein